MQLDYLVFFDFGFVISFYYAIIFNGMNDQYINVLILMTWLRCNFAHKNRQIYT